MLLDEKGLILLKPEEVGEAMDRAAERMRERAAAIPRDCGACTDCEGDIRNLSLRVEGIETLPLSLQDTNQEVPHHHAGAIRSIQDTTVLAIVFK